MTTSSEYYLLRPLSDRPCETDRGWDTDFVRKYRYPCGHDDFSVWIDPLPIRELGENVALNFVSPRPGACFMRDDLLTLLRPEIEEYLDLGRLVDSSGTVIDSVRTLHSRRPVRIRGGPKSAAWICAVCNQLIYEVHWSEQPYLLIADIPSTPIALEHGNDVIVDRELFERIRDQEWSKVDIVSLPVRDEPLDGFPIDLRDLTPEIERGSHWRKPMLMRARSIYTDFSRMRTSPRHPAKQAIPLDATETVRELSDCGLRLTDGLQLTIYDDSLADEDLEARAVAYYDAAERVWLGELDESGVTHVPKRNRGRPRAFRCLRCRIDLSTTDVICADRSLDESPCPVCRLPASAAVAPPDAVWPPIS